MLDTKQIGQRISALRKQHNMTQLELADKLYVSYQAVSNWERGASVPDIAKLPQLASILGVSSDELLGSEWKLLNSIVNGEVENYMENNPVTIEEFGEIAPLLKPAQADTVAAGIADQDTRLTVDDLVDLLPFISDEVLSKIALKIASSPEWKDIRKITDSLDHETLRKITDQFIEEGKQLDKVDLIQFLSDHDCVELAKKAYEKNGASAVLPFFISLPDSAAEEITEMEYQKNGPKGIADFAPYLNSSFLMELAKKIAAKEGIREIAPIAPFLDMQQFSEFIAKRYL